MYWTGHENKPVKAKLQAWFNEELESQNRNIFIAYKDNIPIGYAYTYFIDENKGIETALAVSNNFIGLGYGTEIVKQTVLFCIKYYPSKYIQAWIWVENIASIKIHENAGYRNTRESKLYNNKMMYLFEYIK